MSFITNLISVVLDFIRKYSSLTVPVVIAVVALFLFIPLFMLRGSLAKNMVDSVKQGKTVSDMMDAPSLEQYKEEERYQNQHEKDARAILMLAVDSSRRELISYDIFPEPKRVSAGLFSAFGEKYRKAIEDLIRSIDARDAPTEIDKKKATERIGRTTSRARSRRGRKSSRNNKGSVDAIVNALCVERAKSIKVYANINLFKWYDFWESYKFENKDIAIEDCWYSQVAYWVYEDVVATIRTMNEGSDSVLESDIKRIVGINFAKPVEYPDKKKQSSVIEVDIAEYVTDKKVGLSGVMPWTGRVCDKKIDVIHFNFTVILNSGAISSFMKELCREKPHTYRVKFKEGGQEKQFKHNQITVLRYTHRAIDRQLDEHIDFRYGDAPVVQLDMTCEYVFKRNGYAKIRPKAIEELLKPAKTNIYDDE